MFPRISSAAEAREAVSYLRFPPDGVRGVASQNRMGRFGRVPMAGLGALDDDVIGIVQVETLGSLREIDEIAAVDGVDVLFVGPGDLTYALGVPGRTDDSTYQAAIGRVVTACANHGRSAGVLVRDLAEARRHLDQGFKFIGIGSDAALVMAGATAIVEGFRAAN